MHYKRIFIPNALLFITIVTKYRQKILIENINYLRQAFAMTKLKYPFDIIAIIVNHDHLHMILHPQDMKLYPKIIGHIKSTFTKLAPISYTVNKGVTLTSN